MSKFTVQTPVIHTPSFTKWRIDSSTMYHLLINKGIKIPLGMLDSFYYLTNLEGWGKLFYDLVFNSNLYKADAFDCEDYALKAMATCHERFGLNAFGLVIGDIPYGRHGFNIFAYYDSGETKLMLWEPNEGFSWSGNPFEIDENGYLPDMVVI